MLSAKNKLIFEEIRYTKDGTPVSAVDGSTAVQPGSDTGSIGSTGVAEAVVADAPDSSGSGLEEQSDSESHGSSSTRQ